MELRTLTVKGIKLDVYFDEEDNGVILRSIECTTSADNILYLLADEVIDEIENNLCADLVPQDHDSISSLGLSGMFAPDNSHLIRIA